MKRKEAIGELVMSLLLMYYGIPSIIEILRYQIIQTSPDKGIIFITIIIGFIASILGLMGFIDAILRVFNLSLNKLLKGEIG